MTESHDAIVIGAGIIGCAIAYELTRRGARVLIIDARGVGFGATQASAGVLAPYIEGHDKEPLQTLTTRSLDLYDDFVAAVESDAGQAVLYKRSGTLEVATTEEAVARLQAATRALAAAAVRCEFFDRPALEEAEPQLANDVVAGLLIPTHGFVAAGELTRALHIAAERRGGRLTAGSVRRVWQDGAGIRVEVARETLRATRVVLASGSWTGKIEVAGADPLPVRPVRGQLLYLEWPGEPLRRVTWSDRCYLVPWSNGSLLVGATMEEAGFDERATVTGIRDLLDAACDLVPRAWQAAFQGVRVGLRPATPDELPIIGPSVAVPGLVYATGHFRNGVLLAPLTAKLVGDLILDDRADAALQEVSPRRFGSH